MRFRRKGGADDGSEAADDTGTADAQVESVDEPTGFGEPPPRPQGPWDASDVDDDVARLDFGALLVPAVDGMEVRLDVDEQGTVSAVGIGLADSSLQLQAFAAPRSLGLWDEVRAEMLDGIRSSGGKVSEAQGPFGPELRAVLPAQDPDGKVVGTEPVRFLGIDGPRWFLRGVITGAASDAARANDVHALLRGVVVARGDAAAPPRELLELRVPEDPQLQSGPAGGE